MLFSSPVFIFAFLGCVIPLYYILKRFILAKNLLLFFVSLLFYAWGEPKFVVALLASIVFNHIFGLLCGHFREKSKAAAKAVLVLMAVANLSLLFVFKYLVFFMENIKLFSGLNFEISVIALPLGISFFTFQAMSYVIDVYCGDGKAQKNIFYTGLYIVAFPQLVAGPIVRYETVAEQINSRTETLEDFSKGICRFTAGLAKKVLISNQMAIIADAAFKSNLSDGNGLSVGMAWLGALAYMFQIYYDFSGYSDMAIGLGRVFGFKYDENFNFPYTSKSVTEFWRRWHISLSTWFRNYVYIPLGGSRKGKARLFVNLLIVWLLTGIWHGAEWTFVIWGLYYFVFLCTEKFLPQIYLSNRIKSPIGGCIKLIRTQIIVLFGWVIFRAESLTALFSYLKSMFYSSSLTDLNFDRYMNEKWVFLVLAVIFAMPIASFAGEHLKKWGEHKGLCRAVFTISEVAYPVVYLLLFTVSIAYLLKGTYNPFIYFNF